MKRTCTILLTILTIFCLKQGYDLFTDKNSIESPVSGNLSDIAEEVIAIPLETANGIRIQKARNIRQQGQDLFLISNDILYRFNRNGKFICRITNPHDIKVAGYVINPAQHQLIVLGNTNDIFYYSFGGKLLCKKKLKSDLSDHRMLSATMYKNHVWSVEEKVKQKDTLSNTPYVEHEVVQYDTSFHKIGSKKLVHANLDRPQYAPACFSPQLSVEKETDELYAYEASPSSEYLIRDSLYIRKTRENKNSSYNNREITLFPVRFGKRIWISSYQSSKNDDHNYTFCYDTLQNKLWQVKGGLIDNFYQTGKIADLQTFDLYGNNYCFYTSETLFIVKLKG